MQRIPEQTIEQIRTSNDVVDVISEYVQLTKRGRNWFGLCPFHGEQTPSFSVSQDKQIFHCFGCGAGGNAITFVMDIDNLSFQEAVSKLGSRVGIDIDIEPQTSESPKVSKDEVRMKEAHTFAMNYYHHLLLNTEEGEKALFYLEERGFSRELIEQYRIGWSLPKWDALTNLLERKGFNLVEMAQCGLVIQKENKNEYFDRFRERIMFPVHDEAGHVIAFSGRVLNTESQDAKYMNSPESLIFQKSKVLYHLDVSRPIIRKKQKVIVMEGFMDVIAAAKAGIMNTVATMGTSLTMEHIHKLKRLTDNVTLCYDGDAAGLEAAKRAAQLLVKNKIKTEVAILPNQMDPDDFIQQNGAEAFEKQIINRPQAYLAFMMMVARRNKNFQFENDTLQYVQEVLEHFVGNTSPVEQDLYIRQLSKETNISSEAIIQQFRKIEGRSIKQNTRQQPNTPPVTQNMTVSRKMRQAIDQAEKLLLAHMLNEVDIVDRLHQEHGLHIFIHDSYEAIFVRLIGFYDTYPQGDKHRFLEILEDIDLRKLVMAATLTERDPEHASEEVSDCLRQIDKHRIEIQIQEKMHESREAEKSLDMTRALMLAKQIIELKKSLSAM
ncbi:DNA primase [Paenisporosarcina sp. TG20]|uniref:DNA primase n=1 Tax=Paenisporosarcina sp. TG20 TaxID=1211706 RepID=UPI000317A25D|nr:DNA primase [Paenisporosarcina sp. TG20]